MSEEQEPPTGAVPAGSGSTAVAGAPDREHTTPAVTPQYWLRVHGYPPIPLHSYPWELTTEVVYYNDFYDPKLGRLPGDPRLHFRTGDIIIYYADGGSVLYAVATITGEVEGPFPHLRRGRTWTVPIKREVMVRSVTKAPHAAWLEPPSGWHFLRAVRDYTYIRLPNEDGPYLVEQVRSRASTRE